MLRTTFAARRLQFARFQSTVTQLKTLPEFQKAIATKQLSVVDFYATWCGPCKAISPHVEKLSTKYQDVSFYKVDVDESPDIAGFCGVSAMPTFLFTKNGQAIGKVVGADPRGLNQGIEDLKD
ncbi:LAFE_0C00914g1_1 [Lachancea fermentati]|uniref:LAFE_0C00914g1_1 n=1 Tax=Lachancea fermentati TaxID=4955 RepID=A0A1G4M8Y5_LACFM|nr:LAFE_0C00914g1_1 [Lachancea fermentati]